MATQKKTTKTNARPRSNQAQNGRAKATSSQNSSKRPVSSRKKASSKPTQKTTHTPNVLTGEIMGVLVIAISVFMMLSLFTQKVGAVGAFVNTALIGLFGFGAHLLPFVSLGLTVFFLFSKVQMPTKRRFVLAVFLFWVMICFFGVLSGGNEFATDKPMDIEAAFLRGNPQNGGLLGNYFGGLLISLMGRVGAYLFLCTAFLVLSILISGYSFFSFVGGIFLWFSGVYQKAQEERFNRLEEEVEGQEDDEEEQWQEQVRHEKLEKENMKSENRQRFQDYPKHSNGREHYEEMQAAYVVDKDGEILENRGYLDKKGAYEGSPTYKPKKIFDFVVKDIKKPQTSQKTIHLFPYGETSKTTQNKEISPPLEKKEEAGYFEPLQNTMVAEQEDEGNENLQHVDENTTCQPNTADVLSDDVNDSEIALSGVGIEGYVPTTITADGEIISGKEKDNTKKITPTVDELIENAKQNDDMTKEYVFPPIELLKENPYVPSLHSKAQILENSRKLEETLKNFGVEAKVVSVSKGPTVTRYELSPGVGVKVSKIAGLADDLALNLAAMGIRIEAPVPGKSVVGIEIPNKETQAVFLREVIEDEAFWSFPSKLAIALGKDIAGNTVIADIAKMPHLLIAGATGAGKSVCINTLIASIVYKATPQEVKLLMVDPKVVELSVYNGIPHLLIPVVTDPKKAAGALHWAVKEMDVRYNQFAETKTRDLKGYNATLLERGEKPLPQIVIIIDELADLMMTCGKEVEESICRLAQKARASGIHLIIATQRPSVDVITGLIKANVPSRLAFAVSSGTDSRTILDMVGAEKLMGKGDMLFSPVGLSKPQRIQGSFVSDKEVENLVNFIKQDGEAEYDPEMVEKITTVVPTSQVDESEQDEFAEEAIAFIAGKEKASVSMLQRKFRIGYNRAARMMEELEARGIVGPEDGSKPRKVLISKYDYTDYKERREEF